MVAHLPFVVDPPAQLDAGGSTLRRGAGGEVSPLEGPYRTITACGPAANGLALGYRAFRVYVGGTVADLVAVVAAGLALWLEGTGRIAGFAGVLAAVLVKRSAYLLQPTFAAVRFFNPALFNDAFFEHFGPHDFMGIPLHAAWWIPVYYAAIMFVCNIGGEELWWRGYVLPRQELAFGRATWIAHGILWSAFHLFMQPILWDTLRMSITGWRSVLLRSARKAHGRASSDTASETWLFF